MKGSFYWNVVGTAVRRFKWLKDEYGMVGIEVTAILSNFDDIGCAFWIYSNFSVFC